MTSLKRFLIISLIMILAQTTSVTQVFAQQSTIFRAAYYGHTHEIAALIENGENVNLIDKNGWTSLMYAANMSKVDAVKALINAGADVNFRDRDGWTPLISAESLDVIRLLVENGANVNARAADGWSALDYALWEDKKELINYWIAVGADHLATSSK